MLFDQTKWLEKKFQKNIDVSRSLQQLDMLKNQRVPPLVTKYFFVINLLNMGIILGANTFQRLGNFGSLSGGAEDSCSPPETDSWTSAEIVSPYSLLSSTPALRISSFRCIVGNEKVLSTRHDCEDGFRQFSVQMCNIFAPKLTENLFVQWCPPT